MPDYKFAYVPKHKTASCRQVLRHIGPSIDRIHMHDSAELTLITTQASAMVFNNGRHFRIHTPALIWHQAGAFHELLEVFEQTAVCYTCFYKPRLFSKIPKELCQEQLFADNDLLVLQLTNTQCQELFPLFDRMRNAPVTQLRLLLLCIFDQMAQLVSSGVAPIVSNSTLTYIFEIASLLQTPDNHKLTLEALANQFHVSQSKLKTDFKKITGMTVHTFRRHVQLQSARILLETTQMKQAQIAYSCGFSDESYFICAFRKEYGITPGAYRKQQTQ